MKIVPVVVFLHRCRYFVVLLISLSLGYWYAKQRMLRRGIARSKILLRLSAHCDRVASPSRFVAVLRRIVSVILVDDRCQFGNVVLLYHTVHYRDGWILARRFGS